LYERLCLSEIRIGVGLSLNHQERAADPEN
jgi:hypothetical protein